MKMKEVVLGTLAFSLVTVTDPGLFVGMESFYLLLQFGFFGVLIGLIYRKPMQRGGLER